MKKLFLLTAVFCIAFSAFAFDAEVVSVSGKATMLKGASWIPVSQGNKIAQGTEIQTGFKSSLVLKIKGSSVTVNPMTRIKVEELSENGDKDNAYITLKAGGLKSNVKKAEDRRAGFTVRGPAATASVRGTEFLYNTGYNCAAISATEGSVAVWPSASSNIGSGNKGKKGSSSNAAASPANISDGNAGKGAFTITVGQTATFDCNPQNGGGSPQGHGASENAVSSALNLGASRTGAAASESVMTTIVSSENGAFEEQGGAAGGVSTTGTLTVTVSY